jgi:branched-subunit amino acid transport protein AzlD
MSSKYVERNEITEGNVVVMRDAKAMLACLVSAVNVRQSALQLVVMPPLSFVSAMMVPNGTCVAQGSQMGKLAPPIIHVVLVIVCLDSVVNARQSVLQRVAPQASFASASTEENGTYVVQESQMGRLAPPIIHVVLVIVCLDSVANARHQAQAPVVLHANVVLQRPLTFHLNSTCADTRSPMERFVQLEPTVALVIVYQKYVVNARRQAQAPVVLQAKLVLQRPLTFHLNSTCVNHLSLMERFVQLEPTVSLVSVFRVLAVSNIVVSAPATPTALSIMETERDAVTMPRPDGSRNVAKARLLLLVDHRSVKILGV